MPIDKKGSNVSFRNTMPNQYSRPYMSARKLGNPSDEFPSPNASEIDITLKDLVDDENDEQFVKMRKKSNCIVEKGGLRIVSCSGRFHNSKFIGSCFILGTEDRSSSDERFIGRWIL